MISRYELSITLSTICSRSMVAAASLVICDAHLHRAIRGAHGVRPCVGWGVTSRQLDLRF